MKVVLFCGGQGIRLRPQYVDTPKPMVEIGSRPILWHIMKYYAHFGHTKFILCLGHKGEKIRQAVNEWQARASEAAVSRDGIATADDWRGIENWHVSFVDSGEDANVGERLVAARPWLADDPIFFANYADGVTDLNLTDMLARFESDGFVGSCISVRPNYSFHLIDTEDGHLIRQVRPISDSGLRMNGGFFIFRREIFDYIRDGEDLVEQPFGRLASAGVLAAYAHDGFWSCMDTFKEKMALDEIYQSGNVPWAVWRSKTNVENGIGSFAAVVQPHNQES